jgi:hypothetical protein
MQRKQHNREGEERNHPYPPHAKESISAQHTRGKPKTLSRTIGELKGGMESITRTHETGVRSYPGQSTEGHGRGIFQSEWSDKEVRVFNR